MLRGIHPFFTFLGFKACISFCFCFYALVNYFRCTRMPLSLYCFRISSSSSSSVISFSNPFSALEFVPFRSSFCYCCLYGDDIELLRVDARGRNLNSIKDECIVSMAMLMYSLSKITGTKEDFPANGDCIEKSFV